MGKISVESFIHQGDHLLIRGTIKLIESKEFFEAEEVLLEDVMKHCRHHWPDLVNRYWSYEEGETIGEVYYEGDATFLLDQFLEHGLNSFILAEFLEANNILNIKTSETNER